MHCIVAVYPMSSYEQAMAVYMGAGMRGLVQMFRVRYDYSVFQVRTLWPLLLSVAGVILGAATVLPSSVSIVLGVIAFFLGLGVFVHDVREKRRDWRNYEFRKFVDQFPAADIRPPSTYPDPAYLYMSGDRRGTALVSDAIDQALATRDIPVQRDDAPYRLPKYLEVIQQYVLPKVNAAGTSSTATSSECVGIPYRTGHPMAPSDSTSPSFSTRSAQTRCVPIKLRFTTAYQHMTHDTSS
jgi:hypothetical protein